MRGARPVLLAVCILAAGGCIVQESTPEAPSAQPPLAPPTAAPPHTPSVTPPTPSPQPAAAEAVAPERTLTAALDDVIAFEAACHRTAALDAGEWTTTSPTGTIDVERDEAFLRDDPWEKTRRLTLDEPGTWTIVWSCVSEDGTRTSDGWNVTVAGPQIPTPTPSTSPATPPSPRQPTPPAETLHVSFYATSEVDRTAYVAIVTSPFLDADGMACPRGELVLEPKGSDAAGCTLPLPEDGEVRVMAGWYVSETATYEEAQDTLRAPADEDGDMLFVITVTDDDIDIDVGR